MALRAAVFDFDGVIVDTEPLHFRSLRDTLRAEGVEITEEEYWASFLAYDNRTAIRLALDQHGRRTEPDRVEELSSLMVRRFEELRPEARVFPGTATLVRALAAEVPLAVASGALSAEVDAILEAVGLRDAFGPIVGAEDAPRTKPDPAPYVEAVRRLGSPTNGLSPSDCVAFEDTMAGIDSALGAGMKVVGITNSYPADKLRAAHRVVDSLVDVDVDGLRGLLGG